MHKIGEEVMYGGDRYRIIESGFLESDIERVSDSLRRRKVDNCAIYEVSKPTILSLLDGDKKPIIELSYKVKIQGFTFDLTYAELKEIQTVINGVL